MPQILKDSNIRTVHVKVFFVILVSICECWNYDFSSISFFSSIIFWQENNYSIPIKLTILNNPMEQFSIEASCPLPRTVCNCVSASFPPCTWNSFIICNRGHYSWKALALTSVWRSLALLLPFGPDVHLLETDQHSTTPPTSLLLPLHPFHFSLSFPGTCDSDALFQGQRSVVVKTQTNKKNPDISRRRDLTAQPGWRMSGSIIQRQTVKYLSQINEWSQDVKRIIYHVTFCEKEPVSHTIAAHALCYVSFAPLKNR